MRSIDFDCILWCCCFDIARARHHHPDKIICYWLIPNRVATNNCVQISFEVNSFYRISNCHLIIPFVAHANQIRCLISGHFKAIVALRFHQAAKRKRRVFSSSYILFAIKCLFIKIIELARNKQRPLKQMMRTGIVESELKKKKTTKNKNKTSVIWPNGRSIDRSLTLLYLIVIA